MKRLLPGESNAEYTPGYLLFVRETTLLAQPFDAERLEITGEPFPVAEHVWYIALTCRAAFSVSDSGVLVGERQQ